MNPRKSWGGAAAVAVATVISAAVALPAMLSDDDSESSVSERPANRNGQALALDSLPLGAEPARGYLAGNEFRRGTRHVTFSLEPGSAVTELVAMAEGYLLSTTPDAMGTQWVRLVTRDGTPSRAWEIDGDSFFPTVVVSRDRRLGAFVSVGGKAVVVQDGGRTVTSFPSPEGALDVGFAPVAVSGTDCTGAAADCAMLMHGQEYTSGDGTRAATWALRPGRPAESSRTGIGDVRTVAANGLSAGTVTITEDGDGSCAGVADTRGSILWKTCKDRLMSFSPNSRLVLASTGALYGSGDHELTVLDARTGKETLRLETAEKVGIYEMVWEDDDHVLAVVSDWEVDDQTGDHVDVRWAVVRIGLDGTREYAVAPVPGDDDDFDGPLDLPRG